MAFRPSTGRKINVPDFPKDVRGILRRHLREERKRINPELATAWNVHPNSAYRIMYSKRPFTPQMIAAAVELLKLDEFDATELYQQAAREAGFLIDGPKVKTKREEQKSKI